MLTQHIIEIRDELVNYFQRSTRESKAIYNENFLHSQEYICATMVANLCQCVGKFVPVRWQSCATALAQILACIRRLPTPALYLISYSATNQIHQKSTIYAINRK
jgi:hypothetical protein